VIFVCCYSESYGTQSRRADDFNNNTGEEHPAQDDNCLANSNMPSQGPQWTEFLSCEVCYKLFSENVNRPISLGCGHTVCKLCLSRLQQSKCPFDQSPINCDIEKLPVNYALLQLIGAAIPDKVIDDEAVGEVISDAKKTECYESARKCIEELAAYLKPLSEGKFSLFNRLLLVV
jgi:RING finger/CCCH-type zinc finger protein